MIICNLRDKRCGVVHGWRLHPKIDPPARYPRHALVECIPQPDQEGDFFIGIDNDFASNPNHNTPSDPERQQAGKTLALPINENPSKTKEMKVTPCPGAGTHADDELDVAAARTSTVPEDEAGDVASRKHARERQANHPWAVGGVVLSSLSVSVDALLTDGSKTVRAKALACSLCILKVHGGSIEPACFDGGEAGAGGASCGLNTLKISLQAVSIIFKVSHQPSVQSETAFKVAFNGCGRRECATVRFRGGKTSDGKGWDRRQIRGR